MRQVKAPTLPKFVTTKTIYLPRHNNTLTEFQQLGHRKLARTLDQTQHNQNIYKDWNDTEITYVLVTLIMTDV